VAVHVRRLGSRRTPGEGLRLGTVRRPPRGVRKTDYASRDYFDVWLPELTPSAKLVEWALSKPFTPERWRRFVQAYRREMQSAQSERILEILAQLSRQAHFSVGCYCEREEVCHRSILIELLAEHGAKVARGNKAWAPVHNRLPRRGRRTARERSDDQVEISKGARWSEKRGSRWRLG